MPTDIDTKRRLDTTLPEADCRRFSELAHAEGLSVATALRRLVLRELRAANQQELVR